MLHAWVIQEPCSIIMIYFATSCACTTLLLFFDVSKILSFRYLYSEIGKLLYVQKHTVVYHFLNDYFKCYETPFIWLQQLASNLLQCNISVTQASFLKDSAAAMKSIWLTCFNSDPLSHHVHLLLYHFQTLRLRSFHSTSIPSLCDHQWKKRRYVIHGTWNFRYSPALTLH